MSRKLFEDGTQLEEKDSDRREYKTPENELVDPELLNQLFENYFEEKHKEINYVWYSRNYEDFGCLVRRLMSLLEEAGNRFHPQLYIDALIPMLRDDEFDGYLPKTGYLTALVQASYNLDYCDEFVIDTSSWCGEGYHIGRQLEGKPERAITMHLYGDVINCAHDAIYCNLIFHNKATACAYLAKYSSLTFHDIVLGFGTDAENCKFNLMPNALFAYYRAEPSKGNKLKRMNEDGEWEIIHDES